MANTTANVLILGESGTGKELIARAIHLNSGRSSQPFLAVNCGALPESILESELFGHVRGAFTGAVGDKKGLFRSASGGTLFLDEIGEMPVALQVKLLRALQEHEVTPVGSAAPVKFDARIIAATNKDLNEDARGFCLVAVDALQCFDQVSTFHFIERRSEVLAVQRWIGSGSC